MLITSDDLSLVGWASPTATDADLGSGIGVTRAYDTVAAA
jgi:hypothetical protein